MIELLDRMSASERATAAAAAEKESPNWAETIGAVPSVDGI